MYSDAWASLVNLISFAPVAHLAQRNKTCDLTCGGVLLLLFQHIILVVPLFCLSGAVLHRHHGEVGGHFYTLCFLSVSPVCHTLISRSPPPPPLFCWIFSFLCPATVTLLLFLPTVLRCLLSVVQTNFPGVLYPHGQDAVSCFWVFVPIARILLSTHVTPTPTAPTTQIRKSAAAPPNGGQCTWTHTHTHTEVEKLHALVLICEWEHI